MADPTPKFIAVDFFCGAGGTTHGLIRAGGIVLAGIDNDHRCQLTYERNNRNASKDHARPKFLCLDVFRRTRSYPDGQQHLVIQELAPLIEQARKSFPASPLLFAICAPCQPFARLSKGEITKERLRKHIRDCSLLLQTVRLVSRLKPDLIFSENVASITSSRYGEVWEEFQRSLRRLGYATGSSVINAVNFGVPQYRRRSIAIAVQKNLVLKKLQRLKDLPLPSANPRSRIRTVRETIGGLPSIKAGQSHPRIANHVARNLSALSAMRLKAARPGATNKHFVTSRYGDISLKCHTRAHKKLRQRCFNDVYTRMHPDRPAPTITTRCNSVSNGRFAHYDPKQVRPISIREAALLQTFPKTYVFYPTDNQEAGARMIGNAVPPRLSSFFAKHALSLLRRKRTSLKSPQ
jgi:DNA (cytosine-5)-methyltransferase 1